MVKAKFKAEEFDCPDCGNRLRRMTGIARDAKEPNMVATAYACDECDIGFAITDGRLGYAPWDAKGKRLPDIHCITCNKSTVYKQQFVDIVFEDMFYKFYCPDCAVEYLRNSFSGIEKEKVTTDTVRSIADVYNFNLINAVLSDPVRYQKALENPKMQEALKDLGVKE